MREHRQYGNTELKQNRNETSTDKLSFFLIAVSILRQFGCESQTDMDSDFNSTLPTYYEASNETAA